MSDGYIGNKPSKPKSINSAAIDDGEVTEADISDGAITTAKIANNAVTEAKISSAVIPVIRQIPQNSISSAYTLNLSDIGKHILHPTADTTDRVWTIPANSSVPFPVGTAITIVNQDTAGSLTITITDDTLSYAGTTEKGNRVLESNGIATILKISTEEWIITGVGLA